MRLFAENLIGLGLGFLQSVSYIKPIPTHEKVSCCGEKVAPEYFFLGWVGLWVEEFDRFTIIFDLFPTPHDLVNRRQPIDCRRQGE